MSVTLAFDVYGTLIDPHGVVVQLRDMIGETAPVFSRTWREKQLEYSFRRALMQNYVSFPVCTQQALDYACEVHHTPLSAEQKKQLLDAYRVLPAFDDVRDGLAQLSAADFRLFAFSNGTAEAIETLLKNAGIAEHFHSIVSVDDVRSFKPSPAVYCHFLRTSGAAGGEAWMISSNPFDVIGAMSAGMKAAWVHRSPPPEVVFDPWGVEPTVTVGNIRELKDRIEKPGV